MSEPNQQKIVRELIARHGREPSALIPLLQGLQEAFGYLPDDALEQVRTETDISAAQIEGVSTFYSQFRHRPAGEFTIHVCHGTACHVKGAPAVHDAILRHLNVPEGDDTDPDGRFTVEKVACLGCCTLAPAVKIEDITYGHLSAETVGPMIRDFIAQQKRRGKGRGEYQPDLPPEEIGEIRLGLGSCCVSRGSGKVHQAVLEALAETHAPVKIKRVGCVGMCHQTPLVEIIEPGDGKSHLYAQVAPEDARRIVLKHFQPQGLLRRAASSIGRGLDVLLTDEAWRPVNRYRITPRDPQVESFLGLQTHIATEHCGVLDPSDLEEYRRRGGYEALRRCLEELSPEEVIDAVDTAGLRGRGGAGFPTAVKWRHVREAPGEKKYIICNGDEGDPGAFMDRMLLESYPLRVLEGMTIAAWAVGADEGVLYIRAEYPLAVERVHEAIAMARDAGLLGENILGSGVSLDVRIMEGAGAFVCGEETALLASIEGQRGMPRLRPPYPAIEGLFGKPTLVNNVETYSSVPWILRQGQGHYAKLGTEASHGTKVFALAGKINRGGLIEVPMGITVRQIVEEVGGGVQDGLALKAVQIGGPSGGCVPERLADTPVDFEALRDVGAMMGSGGMVVLAEDDCMVEIARYFLEFTQDQSCGKCTFCRIGTRRMLEILEALCEGRAKAEDIDRLEELAESTRRGSLCGLGKTAPNPVLTTLEYFREEYEAHVQGRCPAKVCKPLIRYQINDECIGCTRCAQACPSDAIAPRPLEKHEIDDEKCVRCGACKTTCPVGAVKIHSP